jgi:hypothetical protein
MIPNALLITVAILLALGFWLMGELKFFVPYKTILFRKFFLKDTGRKLLHLDKQLHVGETSIPAPWLDEEAN